MKVTRSIVVFVACVLTASGRNLPKNILTACRYPNNDLNDISNDAPLYDRLQPLTELSPGQIERTRSLQPNLYYIGSINFSIPFQTVEGPLNRSVQAECGWLSGLSNYNEVEEFDDDSGRHFEEIQFSWNKLRSKCTVSTYIDGLDEGLGDEEAYVTVRVKPLFMSVRLSNSLSQVPDIEMNAATRADVSIKSLDYLTADSKEDIRNEIESRILYIVNNVIRNILTDYVMNRFETGEIRQLDA